MELRSRVRQLFIEAVGISFISAQDPTMRIGLLSITFGTTITRTL